MSLLRTALIAGAAYYYGKYRARKEVEQALTKAEEQTTSVLEETTPSLIQAGQDFISEFPQSWAANGYSLDPRQLN